MATETTASEATNRTATKREVFISHKHRDEELAELVTWLVRQLSGFGVEVHNSSDWRYAGQGFGDQLPRGLAEALGRAGLVILLYTDPGDNWEWCLWECGVATNPKDETPTKVGVFSFAGATPRPYQSSLTVRLATVQGTSDDDGGLTLLSFVKKFCTDSTFWPDGGGAIAPDAKDHELVGVVDEFMERLGQIEPRGVNRTCERFQEITQDLGTTRSEVLLRAMERVADALRWRTEEGSHGELFDQLWGSVYEADLERLAHHTLVFRPPAVRRFWEMLLERAVQDRQADGACPWICLVSGEVRDDPIEFWYAAMRDPLAHAHSYEQPIRSVAGKLKQLEPAADNLVERRFLLDKGYFVGREDRVEQFAAIADWMHAAGITVSLGRREDSPAPKWLDFARIGNVAVSRFESVSDVEDRVLVEDFSVAEVTDATRVWGQNLVPRWTSDGSETFAAFVARSGGGF